MSSSASLPTFVPVITYLRYREGNYCPELNPIISCTLKVLFTGGNKSPLMVDARSSMVSIVGTHSTKASLGAMSCRQYSFSAVLLSRPWRDPGGKTITSPGFTLVWTPSL